VFVGDGLVWQIHGERIVHGKGLLALQSLFRSRR
jgi:hypothetical protein